jgi:molecular chaperone DnaJ/curved DNA-binding protein
MQFQDYYSVLGVSRSADEKTIKKAYRELARKYHPDVNHASDAEERFKAINEAYQVLSDSDKRAKYDQFGADWERYQTAGAGASGPQDFSQWFSSQAGGNPGNVHYEYRTTGGEGFSDFFETLFGASAGRGRRRGRQPQRGEDHEYTVEVPLREAFTGTTRTFEIQVPEVCPTCRGTGVSGGQICPTCEGTGSISHGSRIEVTIPPGIREGQRVRVAGKGSPGIDGGQAGDIFQRVKVRADADFSLDGNDLRTEVDVPLYAAMLGGEAIVKTLTGKLALTIPPETQNGKTFRLRGQGWPTAINSTQRGDLLARVRVVLPTGLTEREQDLFEELHDLRTGAKSTASA